MNHLWRIARLSSPFYRLIGGSLRPQCCSLSGMLPRGQRASGLGALPGPRPGVIQGQRWRRGAGEAAEPLRKSDGGFFSASGMISKCPRNLTRACDSLAKQRVSSPAKPFLASGCFAPLLRALQSLGDDARQVKAPLSLLLCIDTQRCFTHFRAISFICRRFHSPTAASSVPIASRWQARAALWGKPLPRTSGARTLPPRARSRHPPRVSPCLTAPAASTLCCWGERGRRRCPTKSASRPSSRR